MGGPKKKKRNPGSHSGSKSELQCEDDSLVTWAMDVVSSKAAINNQPKDTTTPSPPSRDTVGTIVADEDASPEMVQDFSYAEDEEASPEMDHDFGYIIDSYELARRKRLARPITPLSGQLCDRIAKLVQCKVSNGKGGIDEEMIATPVNEDEVVVGGRVLFLSPLSTDVVVETEQAQRTVHHTTEAASASLRSDNEMLTQSLPQTITSDEGILSHVVNQLVTNGPKVHDLPAQDNKLVTSSSVVLKASLSKGSSSIPTSIEVPVPLVLDSITVQLGGHNLKEVQSDLSQSGSCPLVTQLAISTMPSPARLVTDVKPLNPEKDDTTHMGSAEFSVTGGNKSELLLTAQDHTSLSNAAVGPMCADGKSKSAAASVKCVAACSAACLSNSVGPMWADSKSAIAATGLTCVAACSANCPSTTSVFSATIPDRPVMFVDQMDSLVKANADAAQVAGPRDAGPSLPRSLQSDIPVGSAHVLPNVPTWSSLFKPTESDSVFKLDHIDLSTCRGERKLKVPNSISEQGCQEWHNTLVGFFLGRRLPYSLVHKATSKFWDKAGLINTLATDQGTYFFQFSSAAELEAVLEGGPWNVAGKPIILQKWSPSLSIDKNKVSRVPVWVCFYNVPLEYWTQQGLSYISSMVGKPIQVDRMTATRRRITYARICIEVDAQDDWITSFELEAANPPQGSDPITIHVEYQWTPLRCNSCKYFGHDCNRKPSMPSHSARTIHPQGWCPIQEGLHQSNPKVEPQEVSCDDGLWTNVVRKGKAKVIASKASEKGSGLLSGNPTSSNQEIKISNSFNGLVPYVYDTRAPVDTENIPHTDTLVVLECDRLESFGMDIDIGGPSSPPASPVSSRQRKQESKMPFSGSRPKGRHKY